MTKRELLVSILAALPHEKSKLGDQDLNQIAMRIEFGAFLGGVNELSRAQIVRRSKAEDELLEYGRLCRALQKHILGMSRVSLGTIEENIGDALHPLLLFDKLLEANESGLRAFYKMPDSITDEPVKGTPKKSRARQSTKDAAWAYKMITGKSPTRVTTAEGKAGGPFLEYLKEVFLVLDIKASPEAQTRAMEISRVQEG
jgi:hypothetical protein